MSEIANLLSRSPVELLSSKMCVLSTPAKVNVSLTIVLSRLKLAKRSASLVTQAAASPPSSISCSGFTSLNQEVSQLMTKTFMNTILQASESRLATSCKSHFFLTNQLKKIFCMGNWMPLIRRYIRLQRLQMHSSLFKATLKTWLPRSSSTRSEKT